MCGGCSSQRALCFRRICSFASLPPSAANHFFYLRFLSAFENAAGDFLGFYIWFLLFCRGCLTFSPSYLNLFSQIVHTFYFICFSLNSFAVRVLDISSTSTKVPRAPNRYTWTLSCAHYQKVPKTHGFSPRAMIQNAIILTRWLRWP